MKTLNELENDEKIEFLSRKIDEQITDLDQKLDHVLEKHEKDFLKAYRVQMLKVQDELSQLRARANEKELQSKQEKKISALEQEIAKYRNDCEAIMKYCSMQKQLIGDYTLRRRELREDEVYMETEVTQSKVDRIKLKLSLGEEQNSCEAINFANASASEVLAEMHQLSTIAGIQSVDTSALFTARNSGGQVNSTDKNKVNDLLAQQWSSQDQT